jgi:hypothetical protein
MHSKHVLVYKFMMTKPLHGCVVDEENEHMALVETLRKIVSSRGEWGASRV